MDLLKLFLNRLGKNVQFQHIFFLSDTDSKILESLKHSTVIQDLYDSPLPSGKNCESLTGMEQSNSYIKGLISAEKATFSLAQKTPLSLIV